jgi:acyl transferase domain-containing protein/3-hydroxymyristoyl/3-hydroxydecanoyl-(acyl carrier protein) dehydratase
MTTARQTQNNRLVNKHDAVHDALDIAVVGIAATLPKAPKTDDLWNMILQRTNASSPISRNRWPVSPASILDSNAVKHDKTRSVHACLLDSMPPLPKNIDIDCGHLDPVFHLTLHTGHVLFNDVRGILPDKEKIGIILGNIALPTETTSGITSKLALPAVKHLLTGKKPESQPEQFDVRNLYPAALPALMLAKSLDISGLAYTLDAACASSIYALKLASMELISGRLDMVLSGGVSRPDCMYTQMGFSQLQAVSPSGTCSPFDRKADGLVVGEGAAMVALKRLPDAVRDNDRIYGVIRAIGLSNDIGGSVFAPDSEGQTRAMRRAYKQAGWNPNDVDLVECHGTGTPVGDAVEFKSLSTVWNEFGVKKTAGCVIGSVKSNIGHLLTAAGGAGLVKILLAIKHKILPPSANFTSPSERIPMAESPFRILEKAEKWSAKNDSKTRRAALSAFGFGGINAHLLIEEWTNNDSSEYDRHSIHLSRDSSSSENNSRLASVGITPLSSTPFSGKIAVVGMAAAAGSLTDMESFQKGIIGLDYTARDTTDTTSKRAWNGLDQSEWFRDNVINPGELTEYPLQHAAVSPFRFRIPPAELREMLPQQLLMLKVAADAVDHGGWNESDAIESGVFIGIGLDLNTTNFCVRWHIERDVREWIRNGLCPENICVETVKNTWSPPLTANRTMGALGGMVAGRISRALKVGGAGFTLSADELSGSVALTAAVRMLQHGEIRQALAGAVDCNCDWRSAIGTEMRSGRKQVMDSAVAFVLKRLEDAETASDTILAVIEDIETVSPSVDATNTNLTVKNAAISETVFSSDNTMILPGDTGVVSGMCDVAQAVIALHHRVLPGHADKRPKNPQYWLRNREDGPRCARVKSTSFSNLFSSIRLTEHEESSHKPLALPLLTRPLAEITEKLNYTPQNSSPPDTAFVYPGSGNHRPFLGREPGFAFRHIMDELDRNNLRLKDMFQPHIYWNQPDRSLMDDNPHALIIGHVMYGYFVTGLIRRAGVRPDAIIGYSLGESTALVGWDIWPDRDRVLRQLQASTLFIDELAGPCRVLSNAWNLPAGTDPQWKIVIVNSDPERVRKHLQTYRHVYLLIINTPDQCVVGGHGPELTAFLDNTGLSGIDVTGVTVAHIPEVANVADTYRELHVQPVQKTDDIRVYSGAWGNAYPVSSERCADAILAHASEGIDFVRTIESAYRDGTRHFVEIGPGNSCTSMIQKILHGRKFSVDLLDNREELPSESLFRLLSRLAACGYSVTPDALCRERNTSWKRPEPASPHDIPCNPGLEHKYDYRFLCVDMDAANTSVSDHSNALSDPDMLLARALDRTGLAVRAAHEQYLELSQNWSESIRRLISFQTKLLPCLPSGVDTETERTSSQETIRRRNIFLDRDQCLEFAVGSIAKILGAEFSDVDTFPTRVRLPDEPLMLVDRIVTVDGIPKSMKPGRIVTEHDVLPDAWYLDQGKCPVCITVEAGQADLFLSGYLGIDFETKGIQKYRLLDAEITIFRGLPEPDETIRYDIRITRFFRQNNIWLFHFEYDATIADQPLMRMRNGTAGFFSDVELAAGGGIIRPNLQDATETTNLSPENHVFVEFTNTAFDERQINALRQGCLEDCFGEAFAGLPLKNPARLPGGKMHLIDRIVAFEPFGGEKKLGRIRAEADIKPDAWFLTCHFVDDMVMPGTLMYECCFHALKVLLMGIGWIGEHDEFVWNPKPNIPCQLKCRGQVVATTRTAAYDITVKDIGFDPAPYAIADAMMYADNRPVVEIKNMSVALTGLTRDKIAALWHAKSTAVQCKDKPVPGTFPALYDKPHILAFSNGKPSSAFGDKYKIFDNERIIARLPGPPYQFLDRVVTVEAEPWKMKAGGRIVTEYDMHASEWYLSANGRSGMPFAVLLEIALQPCGWYSAYMGSALYSQEDVSYRNLGGHGNIHRMPTIGTETTLAVEVTSTKVSHSGGMIIQHFEFSVYDSQGDIYTGATYFGFFTRAALAEQVGIRDQKPVKTDTCLLKNPVSYPGHSSLPDSPLRMIDRLTVLKTDGGPKGFGLVEGTKSIDPNEWFFSAHFYQDPVWPGSLGIEAMMQLLQVYALERWGNSINRFLYTNTQHQWNYRGQVLPSNRKVTVQMLVTDVNDADKIVRADGFLIVDEKLIYSMKNFEIQARSG